MPCVSDKTNILIVIFIYKNYIHCINEDLYSQYKKQKNEY